MESAGDELVLLEHADDIVTFAGMSCQNMADRALGRRVVVSRRGGGWVNRCGGLVCGHRNISGTPLLGELLEVLQVGHIEMSARMWTMYA